MDTRTSGLLALLSAVVATPLLAQGLSTSSETPEWHQPFPGFKIIGNVYYVGTYDLSTYLITTPQGHILINTGMPDSVAMIQSNVESLGFKLPDVKILTATHGHSDHVAGMAELKRITGAKMYMMDADTPMVESGGSIDFRAPDGRGQIYEPVKVDRALKDGGKITLGGMELTAHHHRAIRWARPRLHSM
jgi:metallo-beta-lactamase class B